MSKSLKLFYMKGTCSLNPRIIINELGLNCEFETIDRETKKTESGVDYKTLNSKGTVPALMLENGVVLTEGAIIVQYLAESNKAYNLLPQGADMKRYRVLEWMNFIATEIHKSCSPLFNKNVHDDVKATVFAVNLKAKLAFVNTAIALKEYLVNEQFTLADAYLFVILSWMPHLGIDLSEYTNLDRYFKALKTRPSIAKSLKDEGLGG